MGSKLGSSDPEVEEPNKAANTPIVSILAEFNQSDVLTRV